MAAGGLDGKRRAVEKGRGYKTAIGDGYNPNISHVCIMNMQTDGGHQERGGSRQKPKQWDLFKPSLLGSEPHHPVGPLPVWSLA